MQYDMNCINVLSYCRILRMTKKKQQIMQKGMMVCFSCHFGDYMKTDYHTIPNRLASCYLLHTTLTIDVTKNLII